MEILTGYFMNNLAQIVKADIRFPAESGIYQRLSAWMNNEQSNFLPARTSVPIERALIYETGGFDNAFEQMDELTFEETEPTAEYTGKEYEGSSLPLEKMILFFDNNEAVNAPLTPCDRRARVPAPITGRIHTDTGEERTLSGDIYLPKKYASTTTQQADPDALTRYLDENAFITITGAQAHSRDGHYRAFPFLGVNPNYFSVDSFIGYPARIHNGEIVWNPEDTT